MDKRSEKYPCSQCGTLTYKLCYVYTRLVCVDCFGRACDAASKRNAERKALAEAIGGEGG